MVILKLFAFGLFMLLTFRLYSVAKYGRATRRSQGKGPNFDSHRRSVKRAGINLILVVLIVETIVYLNGGNRDDPLRHLHFSFVLPFAALFLTQFWATGKRAKRYHRYIGYSCFIVYAPMLVTGLIMLWRM